jgi:FKBP-type peptidyl-prolyl cis-trans isomerase
MITRIQHLALICAAISLPACAAVKSEKQKPKKVAAGAACKMKTATGLGYTIIKKGVGAAPGPNDKVTINYKGTLATNGKVFDQNNGASFGVDGVVPGFGEGLQLVQPGGTIKLCIPAALGYGNSAAGSIPAGSDLVFNVDLLSVSAAPPAFLPVAQRSCTQKTASGLGYQELRAGSGENATDNHVVLVGYSGYLETDGKKFDESDQAAFPVTDVVPGFSEGLKLMKKGAQYRLCIPSTLGYGSGGAGPIPANANLVFLVDMLQMKTMAEIKAMEAAKPKS